MKLRAVLSQQPVAVLRRVAANAQLTPEPASNKSALVDLLCQRLSSPPNLAGRLGALSREQRGFVDTLAAEGGELLEEDAVQELAQGFDRRFEVLRTSLSEVGLVFRDIGTLGPENPLVGIPDSFLKSIAVADGDAGRLRSVTKSTSVGILRAFAGQLGIESRDSRRPLVVREIRSRLLSVEGIEAYLAGLSEAQKSLLDSILERGSTTLAEARQHAGEQASRELEDMLWKTPLFILPEGHRGREDTPLRLATDIRQAMSDFAATRGGRLESHPAEALETAPPSTDQVQDTSPYLLRDLATVLGVVEHRRPRLLKRGGMARADLRDIGTFCQGDTDLGYPEFLVLVVQAAALAVSEGRRWRLAPDAADRLENVAELQRTLYDTWRETERWNEWSADRTAASGRSSRIEELRVLRQEILAGLHHCEVDTWVSYPRFYELLVRTSGPFRHLAEGPTSGRTLASRGTTADELLRRVLRGALTWIGMVRLGTPEAFGLPLHRAQRAAFQVTSTGLALLEGTAPPEAGGGRIPANHEARIVVQPNFEILSPPDLPPQAYIRLCSFAELRSIDVMARFEITREALLQALGRGLEGDQVLRFLQDHSATAIPQVVADLVEECDAKHGEIEIAPASGYLVVEDGDLLKELYAQERVAARLGPRLSPKAAPLRHDTKPEAFFRLLRQQGYMPSLRATTEGDEDGRHQLILRSSELSHLVAFLDAALQTLQHRGTEDLEDIAHLLSRLRRGLRQVPDQHREEASEHYEGAFKSISTKPGPDEGLRDLLLYQGVNPASTAEEVRPLLGYAIEHRLCVELTYGPEEAERRIVEPASEDPAMLYAYCRSRRGDRVFRLDKVHLARLTGERF